MNKAYLEKWNLLDPVEIASTQSATVYKVVDGNGTAMAFKCFSIKEGDDGDEPISGAAALRYWGGNGAVRLLKNDNNAQLLEYCDGGTLLEVSDDVAIGHIENVVSEIHSKTAKPFNCDKDLMAHLRSLFRSKDFDKAKEIANQLIDGTSEKDIRMLHCDLHHENIMHDSKLGFVAIDPKGAVGDRHYDVSNIFRNPNDKIALSLERVNRLADEFANRLDMNRERILKFAYVHSCASVCWSREDGYDESCGIVKMLGDMV